MISSFLWCSVEKGFFFSNMWTLAYLVEREGKFDIKTHISSKCMKS